MKFKVDQETCIGCAACEETCPEVFKVEGLTSQSTEGDISPELEATALEAEEGCPVDAISHE